MDSATEQAIQILKDGGIVIFPTDTAFGIGCRVDMPRSIDRLFQLRKRPVTQATPVLVSSVAMAEKYFLRITPMMYMLMEKYWPGALTIVGPCDAAKVYSSVRGESDTIGLRMPNHSEVLTVIESVGVPILGPSANFHGHPTPYTFDALDPELVALVDYVLPGECTVRMASTVLDCTQNPPRIVRQGAVVI